MGEEEDPQRLKRIGASAYDYDNDPRWAGYWSNILIPPHMASRSDVVDHFKHKFYQRYIDPDLVVEAMPSSNSSQSARSMPSSSSTSNDQARSHNSGSTTRTSGSSTTAAPNPTSLRWDGQTIQFLINAWVFAVAVLVIIPFAPRNLSNRAYGLAFMGFACSSLYSVYSLYGKPRAWNLQAVQVWFQSVIATKDFIYFIYCLTFVASRLYLKFALLPILCWALEHVAKFLRRNFSHSSLYRKYLEEPCVWIESNTTTISILSSQAEIGLGFLLILSLFSSQRNIILTFMYWQIFLVAENKVLRINPLNIGTSESAVEVFFGSEAGDEEGEIIGLSVSMLSSSVFINVKNKGIFAYRLQGQLLWIAGPLLYQSGYRQGCRKNDKDCYFTSTPVIDQCEATIYISNTEGELYALLVRSPRFKWIQDFSSLDKSFTITPGNNGLLYVTVPVRALVLALDVSTGTVLWQRSIGPLSTADCAPAVDSNGWISIGSLDGFLYSFSPIGVPKKFPKAAALDSVVQVSPLLDCSGYAVYISQTEMEGKINHTIAEYTYISSMKPRNAVFTLLVPATGSIYWSESYSASGQFSSLLSESDLQHFVLDERMLLAFITASKIDNPLPCRSTRQKLASSCSHAEPNRVSIHTGNARVVVSLLFESVILMVLVTVVRFCCLFWRKKKLQGQDLGKFLEKRRSLQLQKKAFDRTITEIKQKTAEEAVENDMIEKLGDLVRDKQDIERKLSTTYSLGRDRTGSKSKSLLPLYDGKTKSYSFQGSKKENVTIFHTLSDTSSADSSSEKEVELNFYENKELAVKAKTKAPMKVDSASDDEIKEECEGTPSGSASGSKGFMNPLFLEDAFVESKEVKRHGGAEVREAMHSGNRSIRRRTLSSTD